MGEEAGRHLSGSRKKGVLAAAGLTTSSEAPQSGKAEIKGKGEH